MSRLIQYPDSTIIKWWIDDLGGSDPLLKIALPNVDTKWIESIVSTIELVQSSLYSDALHKKAAYIFYKIIKNHNFVDGNKRSAVVILYLFYLINGYMLVPNFNVRNLAKKVAKCKASRYEKWILKLEKILENNTKYFN